MPYDIIIGRDEEERKILGNKGIIFLGKHYVKMGQVTSLSNNIYLDVAKSHVVFIVGKRGSGKSYTMGVIAEGVADLPPEVKQNISVIMLDTMGVYWTMKYPNLKDAKLLSEWGLKPKALNITIFTPVGYFKEYKEKGIPTDFAFSIKPSELDSDDWLNCFGISKYEDVGVIIERVVTKLKKTKKDYSIYDIIEEIQADTKTEQKVKDMAENRFLAADTWGIFDEKGTSIDVLAKGGQVTVLDVSCYATMPGGWGVKSLAIGLIAKKLFVERMIARKYEEFQAVKEETHYFSEEVKKKIEKPLVWLVIDEAHEFLPYEGSTVASAPLITILREGRQPGISLILASQQPGKIHTDVMTQADTVIAHRITAKIDVDALGALMHSYMREGLTSALDNLPQLKGSAIIFDDTNEKMFPMRVRPRFTWHGGGAPIAIREEKEIFK
ncbi:MAG: ATP-binding protein [Candidatus Woesearchaeota archaeon]